MTAVRSQIGKPATALQSTPTLFTLDDMRFFHHFIQNAYPHLPVNNTQVWITQVPAFSHGVSLPAGVIGCFWVNCS